MSTHDGRPRIVAGATASLAWQPVDSTGEPGDPGAVVTVAVTRANGTVLKAAGTATTGTAANPRTVALTVAETAQLDWLTAIWSVGGTAVATTVTEVVGGVFMTVAAIRAAEPSLSDVVKYPVAMIAAGRDAAERAFEAETRRAFVPRFGIATVDWRGVLPEDNIRAIRFVRDAAGTDVTTYTRTGRILDLGFRFAEDCGQWLERLTYTVGFEYGYDAPPGDLLQKFARVVRAGLNATKTGVPDRAISFQPAEGGNVVIATPGLGPWIYGIPDVDQVIMRHQWNKPAIA